MTAKFFDDTPLVEIRWCLHGQMNKTKMVYFEKEDILHLTISEEPESNSLELSPNITAELNAAGELIGIEILNASTFIRDSILESAHAKMLSLTKVPPA